MPPLAFHPSIGLLAGLLAASPLLACSSSVIERSEPAALQISVRHPSFVVEAYGGGPVKTTNGLIGSWLLDITNHSGSAVDELHIDSATLTQPASGTHLPFKARYDEDINPSLPLPAGFDGAATFRASGSNHHDVCVEGDLSTAQGFVLDFDLETPLGNVAVRGAPIQLSCGYLH